MTTLKAKIGGVWVPVGGGSSASEVEVSATDPIATNPAAEMWYDTADTGISLPNGPRGIVLAVNGTSSVVLPVAGGVSWVTAAVSALTLAVGRRYKISWSFRSVARTDNSDTYHNTNIQLYDDNGNVNTGFVDHWHQFRSQWSNLSGFVIVNGDGVAREYRMAFSSITVGLTLYPTWFIIEDVGSA